MEKPRVFWDTNVFLEANRTNCLSPICNRYSIETAEKCIEEIFTGNVNAPNRINVDRETLINHLSARHSPKNRDVLNLFITDPSSTALDVGELHLLAWLYGYEAMPNGSILISTADKAAIEAIGRLGWIDSLVSLQDLAQQAGVRQTIIRALRQQYTTNWLMQQRTNIKLRSI